MGQKQAFFEFPELDLTGAAFKWQKLQFLLKLEMRKYVRNH